MYPKEFEDLVDLFNKLPGVGQRTAQRYAFGLLDNISKIDSYADILKKAKDIKKCQTCGFITGSYLKCWICDDQTRDKSKILVVASCQDAEAIEKTSKFNGLYHIIGGLISSTNGVFPSDLNIDSLIKRVDSNAQEIIIATPPTSDGEMTALYIIKLLKEKKVKVTRIAKGIPIGSGLEYADEQTLSEAIMNRKEV